MEVGYINFKYSVLGEDALCKAFSTFFHHKIFSPFFFYYPNLSENERLITTSQLNKKRIES